jgi:hypothetical protein
MNKIKFGLWMVLTYFLAQQMVYLLLVHPILYALATLRTGHVAWHVRARAAALDLRVHHGWFSTELRPHP